MKVTFEDKRTFSSSLSQETGRVQWGTQRWSDDMAASLRPTPVQRRDLFVRSFYNGRKFDRTDLHAKDAQMEAKMVAEMDALEAASRPRGTAPRQHRPAASSGSAGNPAMDLAPLRPRSRQDMLSDEAKDQRKTKPVQFHPCAEDNALKEHVLRKWGVQTKQFLFAKAGHPGDFQTSVGDTNSKLANRDMWFKSAREEAEELQRAGEVDIYHPPVDHKFREEKTDGELFIRYFPKLRNDLTLGKHDRLPCIAVMELAAKDAELEKLRAPPDFSNLVFVPPRRGAREWVDQATIRREEKYAARRGARERAEQRKKIRDARRREEERQQVADRMREEMY
uniref:Uncharacterized protein n=1 Tax=Phaeomonas parva TaxID=124430 RepID=A0A6U4BXE3_9STRA|mmetsp:Transcript_10033/g.29664  ORF Transcript_10033/g.29664 Transcript_10033/m.29664 type:complete len:337 (+) Transcript_10033:283-1293(+)